ncbi:MAG TPA: ABC-F family ATP-binding cassette domain-containing protein, partial [Candidatus Dojkabacteria bacterium]|nr:ABC-F family ATP-binding cassette domain-containing protein [Candidatus Dojkabacteria bacterium]
MIKGNGLTKEYNNTVLFKDISFHIVHGEKIALIGRNGIGKSTLFRLINGLEQPTNGTIELVHEKLAYLTQEFDFPENTMIGEFLEDISRDNHDYWRTEKIAGQLGLTIDPYREISTLSGGEKMRLKLTQLLYDEPTTLILDEPTNHLDIIGIQWLKKFLHSFKGTVLLISHDRDLINDVVNKIYEIDQGILLQFSGNYDDYVNQKQQWIENKELEYNRFVERKKKLEILLHKAQVGIIRSRSGNATEAAKKRYDREITQREVKQYEKKAYSDINISGSVHSAKLVLKVEGLNKAYGDKKILDDISFEIRGNEKIWLFGENGMGKSTLVKCILGLESHDSGTIKIGENINIGYFEQKQKPMEDEEKLIDYYMKHALISYYQVPSVLNKYLFTKDDLIKPVKLLSPGQQARLKFALFAHRSTKEEYQLLILDEPAQHLDIETKEIVERTINEFKGAVILISHD